MRMRLTIMMAITTRTKRRTMKTGRMMITVMMPFILRQQQKILKTCWTESSKFSRRERSRAREDISLVPHLILNPNSPSHTHTHTLFCMEITTQESTMKNTSSKPERTCGGDRNFCSLSVSGSYFKFDLWR